MNNARSDHHQFRAQGARLFQGLEYGHQVTRGGTDLVDGVHNLTQVNTGLEGIRKENHSMMVKLIAQLMLAEVRLFQHERSDV